MPFGKDLSHIIEEQIVQKINGGGDKGSFGQIVAKAAGNDSRFAAIEANVQRLAEKLASYISSQKQVKRNSVDYVLQVVALHGMRLAVTAGRALFTDLDDPVDMPYTYLSLSPSGATREIRYIYVNKAGMITESATDPSNISPGYIPLALVDVWAGAVEVTQDRIKDIRPMAGSIDGSQVSAASNSQLQLTGNVTLQSPDTGNDSFVVAAATPAGLRVNVSSGRALVDGQILDAQGGEINLANHRNVIKEFIAISDGVTKVFNLYHNTVSSVTVYVNDVVTSATVNGTNGTITFAAAPAAGAKITASYTYGGNYMLVFLVEKAFTPDGQPYGIIGWKAGSNRTPAEPPQLPAHQHAIAKVDMSSSISAITDNIIDNSYEIKNLTQEDLQYGGQLAGSSLKAGTITGDKIAANSISTGNLAVGAVDAANIKSGAINASHISAGAIQAQHISAGAITAGMIQGGTISADKFESNTWGDMSQAIRYVKAILGGAETWKRVLSKSDLSVGQLYQVAVLTEDYPAIRLDTQRHWDTVGATWDSGSWDIPVYSTGYWESASIDYGSVATLQAEFWAKPIIADPAVTLTVKAKYSSNNVDWTDYEVLEGKSGLGYLYWTGTLLQFRYFKVRVEFSTTNTGKYALLGDPEVRAANCQIGSEDIIDGAVTSAKLSAGALASNISIITGTVSNGGALPLPAGYTKDKCTWIVRHDRCVFSNTASTTGIPAEVAVDPTTLIVRSYWREQGGAASATSDCQSGATIAYMVIGIK